MLHGVRVAKTPNARGSLIISVDAGVTVGSFTWEILFFLDSVIRFYGSDCDPHSPSGEGSSPRGGPLDPHKISNVFRRHDEVFYSAVEIIFYHSPLVGVNSRKWDQVLFTRQMCQP